ncbi:MAG TPA: ubiquinol-cytochrome c reductase iron-sulfur subunit [Luteimonas sp.]|nr:ubiquinol-cytochrome c reductase iron-sulfur subunit [Luteimonas sp.]
MGNEGVMDPVEDGGTVDNGRRRFLTATTAVVGAAGAAVAVVPFVKSWLPSARAQLAGAPVTADISALAEGQRLMMEWRGQPIWIVKRSPAILAALPTLDGQLRDPKSENLDQQPTYVREANPELRSLKPEISVLVGLCTHLGCSPEMIAEIRPEPFDPNWKGGYFCPCHKSKFDMAGRVFQGVPAPTNLVVPPHYFVDDNTIVIGEDPKGAA